MQEERQFPGTDPRPLRSGAPPTATAGSPLSARESCPGRPRSRSGGSAGPLGSSGALILLPEPRLPSPPPARQRCVPGSGD